MIFRRCIAGVLGALFLSFVWANHAQASAFRQMLHGARPAAVLWAALLQIGTLFNQPAFFQSLYTLVGIEVTSRELAPVVLAGRFVNIVAPAAGLGETALLFDQARRRGWDLGRVTLVTTLYFALNFAVFALILLAGFAYLSARGDLNRLEILAASPLFVGLGAGALLLWQVAKKPDALSLWLQKILARVPQRGQKFLPSACAAEEMALSFAFSLRELRGARGGWTRPAIHAAMVDALEIAVLAACLQAFSVAVSPALLVACYAIGTLFTVVSLTPQGLGAVEGALGVTLISFGVSIPHAAAVVLLYRGFSFWLPLGAGFVAMRAWSKTRATGANLPAPAPLVAPR